MRELSGIDDPAAERAILKRAQRKSLWSRAGAYYLLLMGVIVAAASAVIDMLGLTQLQRLAAFVVAGATASVLSSFVLKKAQRKAVVAELRALGRCTRCGYMLDPHAESCSECGASRPPAGVGRHPVDQGRTKPPR